MLFAASALKGYAIAASDGTIGSVRDVLLDERTWKIRWLVVDTGHWLTGHNVLIPPSLVERLDIDQQIMSVRMTKARVAASPDLTQDQPVSMQMDRSLHNYYGTDPNWGDSYFGMYPMGLSMPEPSREAVELAAERTGEGLDSGDPYLRSQANIIGYHMIATDGTIGHLENLLISDDDWTVRYLVVDTKNWWPGEHVLLSPFAVREINWSGGEIELNVTQAQVKGGPVWDPAAMIDRASETRLHRHYGWPGYGF